MHTLHRLWVALAYHWVWHGRLVTIGEDLVGYWAIQPRWSKHQYAKVFYNGSWHTYDVYDVPGEYCLPVIVSPTRESWAARQRAAKLAATMSCIRQRFI